MTRYFAELDGVEVVRVVVCPDLEWLETQLGGLWVETADPYAESGEVTYCGPGYIHDPTFPQRFAQQWVQPVATDEGWTFYAKGTIVAHQGRLWRSTVDDNVWEPGVSGWHDAPLEDAPQWIAPTGSHDAYEAGAVVLHNDETWVNVHGDGNVWEPGVFGWEIV